MKPYTKTGDKGTTRDLSGRELPKTHPLIEAGGSIDELNAHIGLALAAAGEKGRIRRELTTIQRDLFIAGAMVSALAGEAQGGVAISEDRIEEIAASIDKICDRLPEQTCLVVPGGCELAARLHVVRTVCRRAERRIVALKEGDFDAAAPLGRLMRYFNRLGDLLFVLSRLANQQAGIDDMPLEL